MCGSQVEIWMEQGCDAIRTDCEGKASMTCARPSWSVCVIRLHFRCGQDPPWYNIWQGMSENFSYEKWRSTVYTSSFHDYLQRRDFWILWIQKEGKETEDRRRSKNPSELLPIIFGLKTLYAKAPCFWDILFWAPTWWNIVCYSSPSEILICNVDLGAQEFMQQFAVLTHSYMLINDDFGYPFWNILDIIMRTANL